MKSKLVFATILLAQIACEHPRKDKIIEHSKSQERVASADTTQNQILVDILIKDEQTAIEVSEAILFRIYGKDNIIQHRPYEVNLVNDKWVLKGSLPKGMIGGTFEIIITASDCQVIKLAHGK